MRLRAVRNALTLHHGYVCLSCRLQVAGAGNAPSRRFQHSGSPREETDGAILAAVPKKSEENIGNDPGSDSRFEVLTQGLIPHTGINDGKEKPLGKLFNALHGKHPEQLSSLSKQKNTQDDENQEKQRTLQQKFAAERRQQMLKLQIDAASKDSGDGDQESVAAILDRKPACKELTRAQRRAKAQVAKKTSKRIAEKAQKKENKKQQSKTGVPKGGVHEAGSQTEKDSSAPGIARNATFPESDAKKEGLESKAAITGRKAAAGRDVSHSKKNIGSRTEESSDKGPKSETERKLELARKLAASTKGSAKKPKTTKETNSKSKSSSLIIKKVADKKQSSLSDTAGFTSLQGALGKNGNKKQASIEKADATKLEITPIEVKQPPVPNLSFGLERVLFNPGVYQLQDPRSRVYNFDPYLQNLMPVAEFDFNALKEYITSSRDKSLKNIAREHNKRYVGSTSSMTGALAHFHFLLSQWRRIDTSMLSKDFPASLSSFTELQRTPSAIFLRWKDGSYAIDADKQFASANILSMLGKSMEKLLTLNVDDYERYRKSSPGEVTDEEQFAPESYHYSTMGDFLMRSQLDAHDPRLPGTGMFDLKTRAVISIRMDVSNYEQGLGYQIKSRQGEWESYEREYYDMIRAAFLKYSMQVRMGRMDGIFVAFHNIERIFGFQYISLPEMDSTIHGQWDTSLGDQEFKLSLDLLNKILNKATQKFPETSLRIHFETREAATPFMYIFAEPVTEEQVADIQGQNDAKIQEFERNILGLNRDDQSENQTSQDDDGKWENIQASVQEAMDKDEISIDDINQIQESQDRDLEQDDSATRRYGVIEEGPLYANRNQVAIDEQQSTAMDSEKDRDIEEEGIGGTEEVTKVMNEGQGGESLDEAVDEEHNVRGAEQNRERSVTCYRENVEEQIREDGPGAEDDAGTDQSLAESALGGAEVSTKTESAADDEIQDHQLREDLKDEKEAETHNAPVNKKDTESAERAAYTPLIPGEATSDKGHRSEADSPFLDAMDQEKAQSDTSPSSEILAMTLTLRNKVNNKYVLRPENLTAGDVWSIEYDLVEVPTQQKARALYEACQVRRKKKLDAPVATEDAEVVNHYLANLRKMSKRGRGWRREMDERDSKMPVQVLGRGFNQEEGEGDLSDQEPEA